MKMKKILLSLLTVLFMFHSVSAAVVLPSVVEKPIHPLVEKVMHMTPKQYEQMTGKKLTLGKKIQLKIAQKKLAKAVRKGDQSISKGLYVVLAIFGLGWVAMGILDDFSGTKWIISLVLYLLFYLPGLIYTLIKMKDYYN
jgi:uncharacterized membrane protein YqaE (UPF0057 family)